MWGFFERLFGGFARALEKVLPVAATVAKAKAAESINKTDKIPDEYKPVVLELVAEAVAAALEEVKNSVE